MKLPAVVDERRFRAAAKQSVRGPAEAGADHQQRAERMRRDEAGRDEVGEGGERDGEAEPFERAGPIAPEHRPAEDADLHAGEEDQRPGAGAEQDVGDREGEGVAEQRGGGAPAATDGDRCPRSAAQQQQQCKNQGARGEPDAGIA